MSLARLTVDLSALRANFRLLTRASHHRAYGACGAVVKADAYGLGARPVAHALVEESCTDFFVATVEEGLNLSGHVGDARIYVFSGPVDATDAALMAANGLTPVLNDAAQVSYWRRHGRLPVAIHADTGMNRLGFEAAAMVPEMFKGLEVALVLSHLANADEPTDPMNSRQVALFETVKAKFPTARTSLANSAAVLSGVQSDLDRPGIALYGGNPFSSGRNPMQPVATLEACVVGLRNVRAGEPVGYGGTFTAGRNMRLAILGIGYADGIPRGLSSAAEVAYRETRLPVVGRVSMDMMNVDASAVAEHIEVGDWVEVFGRTVSVDDTAAWASTISYEVLTRIGMRVERRYARD